MLVFLAALLVADVSPSSLSVLHKAAFLLHFFDHTVAALSDLQIHSMASIPMCWSDASFCQNSKATSRLLRAT